MKNNTIFCLDRSDLSVVILDQDRADRGIVVVRGPADDGELADGRHGSVGTAREDQEQEGDAGLHPLRHSKGRARVFGDI